jgi:GMP synthase (glutamine-hydrolysing)
MDDRILILDFGSQYTKLIARRIRELNVYSEIFPFYIGIDEIKKFDPKGIILSGGPSSIKDKDSERCSKEVFNLGIPILGICYGMQLIVSLFGGEVIKSKNREYGEAEISIIDFSDIFSGFDKEITVWMSHGDSISKVPNGFIPIAYSKDLIAGLKNKELKIFGLQFHPEVSHTKNGLNILKNFLFNICKCSKSWKMSSFVDIAINEIKDKVLSDKVICALSGGVDSFVTGILISRAIGSRLVPIFIDNGLLRGDEIKTVKYIFKKLSNIELLTIDSKERFLKRLKGITDPEKKRKVIGDEFIKIFEEEAKKIGGIRYLAQGTLYPDVIESGLSVGPSNTIKTHHNVGGLPKRMKLKLIEPLRNLFKDEVRLLGRELGIPEEIINKQPFPGPGLAVRVIGEVTEERLDILRKADSIIVEEIKKEGLYEYIWQSFAVLLPIKSVGVMGDGRTYESVIAIRAVNSEDGMTADWVRLPYNLLGKVSRRITNEIRGVNRVVYDITSKPPSTIEWE